MGSSTSLKLGMLRFAVLALLISGFMAGAQEQPPLPAGLGGNAQEEAQESPSESESPPLPAGLGGDAGDAPEEPSLPAGLGGAATDPDEAEEPALPSGLGAEEPAEAAGEDEPSASWREQLPLTIHGFWETRAGIRTQSDPAQSKDTPLAETRLQIETGKFWDFGEVELKADTWLDGVTEQAEFDLRRLRFTWSPFESVDVRIGRQVLTWGTGDLLFINDLFPKDWQSFLSGREVEYLKAPGDAVRIGWFHDWFNLNLVYSPQFDPDRFITGERISYWNPLRQGHSGADDQVDYNAPSSWFQDDEWALRIYRNIGSTEVAAYAYSGYWKSPGGQRLIPIQARFPKLRVYGASVITPLGPGIGNIEAGYYDSYQDRSGRDPFVNNSEFRLLLGYEQELATELTGSVQYYLEHMLDYDEYRDTLPPVLFEPKDENRHLVTLRLTKLLLNQELTLSLFTYYSPSDNDAFLRPKATYTVNDNWTVEAGANIFAGKHDHTFFGQFENNSSIYASMRFSF